MDLTALFPQIPMVRGVTSDLQSRRIALIHKRLTSIQRDAPLSDRRQLRVSLLRFVFAYNFF
jgi:hypothetical protein